MQKQGFHRWAWLVVFLFGGWLMIFGGAQDVALFFGPELVPVRAWHPAPAIVSLLCGLIVLVSAGLNLIWGWQLRGAETTQERLLGRRVALISALAVIADWLSGYYGFGSLMALFTGLWLMRR